jgi:hypothetical protein
MPQNNSKQRVAPASATTAKALAIRSRPLQAELSSSIASAASGIIAADDDGELDEMDLLDFSTRIVPLEAKSNSSPYTNDENQLIDHALQVNAKRQSVETSRYNSLRFL